MKKRRQLSKTERREVFQKTRGRCAYCGCELKIREMQVDHVHPLSRGGADALDNMLPACRSCNHRKGSETVESFRDSVERFPKVLARDSDTSRYKGTGNSIAVPCAHDVLKNIYVQLCK